MTVNLKTSAEKLAHVLECPVNAHPLASAVSLSPCMHKLNEVVAQQLFGIMQGDQCAKKNIECPECTVIVTAYYPDRMVRSVVKAAQDLLGSKLNHLNLVRPGAIESDQKKGKEIIYPGMSGKFKLISVNLLTSDCSIHFQNTAQGSLFKELVVRGHEDEGIGMSVTFKREQVGKVIEYLESRQLWSYELMFFRSVASVKVTQPQCLKIFFSLFIRHNEIPAPWQSNISKWVEVGKWSQK